MPINPDKTRCPVPVDCDARCLPFQHVNFVGEGGGGAGKIVNIERAELARVEAVLEGVEVAGRSAAGAGRFLIEEFGLRIGHGGLRIGDQATRQSGIR